MDKARKKQLKELQRDIRYKFKHLKLLNLALTHKSFAYQTPHQRREHNERLEFLGDSVISLVTSEFLYKKYSNLQEGDLTKLRSQLVCAPSLEKFARHLKLGKYILLGKGQRLTGARARSSNLTRAFEALVAAIYLDKGLPTAKRFVIKYMEKLLSNVSTGRLERDFKSILQEFSLNKFGVTPNYEVIKETGPEHRKEFNVCVKIGSRSHGTGKGPNKKSAEQASAKEALSMLK